MTTALGNLELNATPADDLIDVQRRIVVTGLPPGAQVGIVAQTRRGTGVLWHSRAAFVAAADEAKTRGVTKRIQNGQIALTRDAKTRASAQSN